MAQRLADEAPDLLAGIGVVAAGVAVNSTCAQSARPMPALFMWGTDDPIAPFDGGPMAGNRGVISSELQDVQELTNFFERTVSAYQVGVEGEVGFDDDF